MSLIKKQAVIIGGGPGGLAAAAELKKKGIDDLLILEREHWLGGILRQCIHDGFGLSRFGCSSPGRNTPDVLWRKSEGLESRRRRTPP